MKEITGKTRSLCVIGDPVKHSFSPVMHNEAIRLLELDYVYTAFEVPERDLADAIRSLKLLGFRGCNVTMPGKRIAAQISDTVSDVAALSGSVNTIVFEDGLIKGYSTDGYGFLASCENAGVNIKEKHICILGAGGAASSIIASSAHHGASHISIFRRKGIRYDETLSYAEKVSDKTGTPIDVHDISDNTLLKEIISESSVLVNTTNVGMKPDETKCLIPDKTYLRPSLLVMDIVYNPIETKLLQMAKEAGCITANGVSMLLYQGEASFRLFTGMNMPLAQVQRRLMTCL